MGFPTKEVSAPPPYIQSEKRNLRRVKFSGLDAEGIPK
jgi:hypothetical protein